HAVDFLHQHADRYAVIPPSTWETPGDPVAACEAWGTQGFGMIGIFRSDVHGHLGASGGYRHACCIVASDGKGFHVYNQVYPDPGTYYNDADFRALLTGVEVFHRDIPPDHPHPVPAPLPPKPAPAPPPPPPPPPSNQHNARFSGVVMRGVTALHVREHADENSTHLRWVHQGEHFEFDAWVGGSKSYW